MQYEESFTLLPNKWHRPFTERFVLSSFLPPTWLSVQRQSGGCHLMFLEGYKVGLTQLVTLTSVEDQRGKK